MIASDHMSHTNNGCFPTTTVSIVIPSYNRMEELRQTLNHCLALQPAPAEVIVVDDCSSPKIADCLADMDCEKVKLIRLPQNSGQAFARSVGMATASADYVVSLDDDANFLDADALARVVERFRQIPSCGILAFRIFTPREKIEAAQDRLFQVGDHITCGAAYRATVLHRVGYHLPFLRYASEEADISIKVLNAGFQILRDDNIRVFHNYDPMLRDRIALSRVRRLGVRNDLLQTWVYFPFLYALPLTVWRMVSHLRFGLRHKQLRATVLGYLAFLSMWPVALAWRKPVTGATAWRYLTLRGKTLPYPL